MGPGYFIIAILGCADGAVDCKQVAVMPARYESFSACAAATQAVVMANTHIDAPTIVAECRAGTDLGMNREPHSRRSRSREG
jgi:hypothetical protein